MHLPVREMMYGTREVFEYFQCPECGCLQIGRIPSDLAHHYKSDYYSLTSDQTAPYQNPIKNSLNRIRDLIVLFAPLGNHLPFRVRVPHLISSFSALRRVPNLRLSNRLLDVGCGSGQLLHRLANAGFQSLTGIDPFVAESRSFNRSLKIIKGEMSILDSEYDLILLNHSFEHLTDPVNAFLRLAELLAPGGIILIRIPVVDSLAWKMYDTNWFQLDAPRHLYLHSIESIQRLATQARLTVVEVHHDSDHHQFQMSERFCANIPTILPPEDRFMLESISATASQIKTWKRMSSILNDIGLGDQACFYLRHE